MQQLSKHDLKISDQAAEATFKDETVNYDEVYRQSHKRIDQERAFGQLILQQLEIEVDTK
ncbi:hypothetical protein [Loigolactobacillus bifermentans]|uniref:Uncharacterized protein n=1 Tax=Loigolactobacillus bifermentans DSM 20003 TaxID=1423726 RepID=A0A0R1GK63_9LACO|nr:hypothetical protein [Loigolactobacillus bifermentans]KRK34400.1 hypothetical protein FC07_GL000609 [Loigolactobacillus bifermentans DSM 20003]QGG60108.1 hypothetical protein LB003_06385 [Loigolactobacillus bifermentans]